jgi:hypothetical protein
MLLARNTFQRALASLLVVFAAALQAQAETAIFWISGPVRPSQAVLLTGYFPKPETLSVRVMSRAHTGDNWRNEILTAGTPVKPLRATQTTLSFALPAGTDGIYAFRIDQDGESPILGLVNRPEVWWMLSESPLSVDAIRAEIETNASVPGATLRLFGRCLTIGKEAGEIEFTSVSGRTVVLKTSPESPYALKTQIPLNMAPGKYSLRVRTDSKVLDEESTPREIEIHAAKSISLKTISVDDFGAIGNGSFDNSKAFSAAFARAVTLGGAEVRVPKGGFFLSKPLMIPPGVYLSGASVDSTILAFPDPDTPPPSWISGTQYFGLKDLSIYCGNHNAIVSSDMSGSPDKSGHVRVLNIRILGSAFRSSSQNTGRSLSPEAAGRRLAHLLQTAGIGAETLRLSGQDLIVEDSYFLGSGKSLTLLRASGAVIRRNKISNGMWYNSDLSEDIISQDNIIEGAIPIGSGGSYSTFEVDPGAQRHSQNIYTAHNTYSNMLGGDREAITTDGGEGPYVGLIEKTDGKILLLKQATNWRNINWEGSAVIIVNGHGMGQWRPLTAWKNRQIELSAPFEIGPDSTSIITIVPTHLHYIFYRNHFDEAGVAIQFWGSSIEHIAAENDATRAGGYYVRAINYHGSQPVLDTQLLGNEIRPGLLYDYTSTSLVGPPRLWIWGEPGTTTMGLVLRDNLLADPAQLIVKDDGTMKAILLEGNQVSNPNQNIQIDKRAAFETIIH